MSPLRDEAAAVDFFEKRVRPVLAGHCYNCHSADTKPAGGLRVDDRKGLLDGGDTGPAVVPGDPDKSLLLRRVVHKDPKRADAQGGRAARRRTGRRPDPVDQGRRGLAGREGAGIARQAEASLREAEEGALGLADARESEAPRRARRVLAAGRRRPVPPGPAGSRGASARRRRREGRPPAPGDVRPDRPAAGPRRPRRLSGRHQPGSVRQGRRPAARVAVVRRAMGPALARRRALWRVRPDRPGISRTRTRGSTETT